MFRLVRLNRGVFRCLEPNTIQRVAFKIAFCAQPGEETLQSAIVVKPKRLCSTSFLTGTVAAFSRGGVVYNPMEKSIDVALCD
jgi:hypothetical protein